MKEWTVDKYRFVMITPAFPEQYHVYDDAWKSYGYGVRQVAYVRLRWGQLCVHIPNSQGNCLVVKRYDDDFKGMFDSEEERLEAFREIVNILRSMDTGEDI